MAKSVKSKWNGFSLKPRKDVPEGLWLRCSGCEEMVYKEKVEQNLNVCPQCGNHFRINAATRIKYLAIMYQSGLSIAHFHFNQETDSTSIDDLLMAGGLTSLSQVISSMVESKKRLDSVDHGGLKLFFQYGKYLITVLVVSAPLVILRSKLKKVTETLEMLYEEDLAHWDGDLTRFTLLEQVVDVHFTLKPERKVGGA